MTTSSVKLTSLKTRVNLHNACYQAPSSRTGDVPGILLQSLIDGLVLVLRVMVARMRWVGNGMGMRRARRVLWVVLMFLERVPTHVCIRDRGPHRGHLGESCLPIACVRVDLLLIVSILVLTRTASDDQDATQGGDDAAGQHGGGEGRDTLQRPWTDQGFMYCLLSK